jgi:hypothetical protein
MLEQKEIYKQRASKEVEKAGGKEPVQPTTIKDLQSERRMANKMKMFQL